jgi:hypothetical protein
LAWPLKKIFVDKEESMKKEKKKLLPAIALSAAMLFMAACEGPVLDNDVFGISLERSRALSKVEKEVKDAPDLKWQAAQKISTITGKDMLALDFGYDENNRPVFVAGGRVGEIDYSYDGNIWTQATDNGGWGTSTAKYDNVINGIVFGNGTFVAVGDSNAASGTPYVKIAYSTNGGDTWTGITAGSLGISNADFFRSVAFGKDENGAPVFVAGCNSGGTMMYSKNGGQTWTAASPASSAIFGKADCQAIAFGMVNNVPTFVAVGGNSNAAAVSAISTDGGKTWTTTTPPPPSINIFCKGLIYANNLFTGCGQGGYVTVNKTGQPGSWTDAPSVNITTFLNTVAYGYGKTYQYYVVGSQNVIGYRGDLLSASLSPLGTYIPSSSGSVPNWINQIAFGITKETPSNVFVAVGDNGTVLWCAP